MKRVEYFPKKMAEREAALVASPASGQDGDRPTAPGQCLGRKSGFRPGRGPPDSSGPIQVVR